MFSMELFLDDKLLLLNFGKWEEQMNPVLFQKKPQEIQEIKSA